MKARDKSLVAIIMVLTIGVLAWSSLQQTLYLESSATQIRYGETATYIVYSDVIQQGNIYYWYLDGLPVEPDMDSEFPSAKYTTSPLLEVGVHTISVADFTGDSTTATLVVGTTTPPTPIPSTFFATLSPESVSIVPPLTQEITLTLQNGVPSYKIYWVLDGQTQSIIDTSLTTLKYQISSSLPQGTHILKATVVSSTLQQATSNTVTITVTNMLPSPTVPSPTPYQSPVPNTPTPTPFIPNTPQWFWGLVALAGLSVFASIITVLIYRRKNK